MMGRVKRCIGDKDFERLDVRFFVRYESFVSFRQN
jgi:hypothetical protein